MKEKKTAKVLIVDDEMTARARARVALEQSDYEVVEAEDGVQALDVIEQSSPDIVLLDICMPRMNGLSTCAEIRKRPTCTGIPVLMVTGMDDDESISRAYEAGATDFLAKPVSGIILKHRVRYILRASRLLEDLREAESKSRAILNAIPDQMFRVSKDGDFLEFSSSATDALDAGYHVGGSVRNCLPEAIACRYMRSIERTLTRGGIDVFEYQLPMDGRFREYEARVVQSGQDEVLVIVRDITDAKRLEEQLQQAHKLEVLSSGRRDRS